jgi:hypothetical protein
MRATNWSVDFWYCRMKEGFPPESRLKMVRSADLSESRTQAETLKLLVVSTVRSVLA